MKRKINDAECIFDKASFIKDLSNVLVGHNIPELEDLNYVAFIDADGDVCYEFLIVKYKGGVITARNVHGDSKLAMVEELPDMIWNWKARETDVFNKLLMDTSYWRYDKGGSVDA